MADGENIREVRAPTAAQLALVRSLPDNNKVKWEPQTWKLPVDTCFSEQHHRAEQERIFNRMALPAAPSGLLPQNGSYVRRTIFGKEVIFTRDEQGAVHAMLNVCMHRGSRIVTDDEPHKGRLLSCPFHAWGYDLKGRCAAVPREETFQSLDKSQFGLRRLQCRELGGVIWLKMDLDADDDFSTVPPALIEDFEALGVPNMHLFATGVHEVEANWKLVMDTFQEGYHVIRLHVDTLKGRYEDSMEIVERLGLHMRRAAGRIDFQNAKLEGRDHSIAELRKLVTFHYTLFPSAVMICSQYYVTLMIFMPTGPATCRVINYMLTDFPPRNAEDLDRFTRSHAMTNDAAFLEDYAAAAWCQAGISTGAIKEFTLCPLERYVSEFHQIVEDVLAGREAAGA